MALALSLGRRGLGNTWPNPAVGAVIVKDGIILARGWTQPGGRPHAEVEALRHAKKEARGATMYVTLEPCSHQGKSPPCADAIIKAGIARVVSALEDPNPEVAGQGHARLRAKGIAVEVGLAAPTRRGARTPATSRASRCSARTSRSSSPSPPTARRARPAASRSPSPAKQARNRVFQMRAQSDAILVGIGTVLADNPQLTCRLPGMEERSPVRVVLDARLQLPMASALVATVREWPTWVFAARCASDIAQDILEQKGCKVFRVDDNEGRLDLDAVLKMLADEGISRLMVEGGPTVASSFVAADKVDEAALIYSDKLIGDDGIAPLEGMALDVLTGRLHARGSEPLGADTLESYERK